MRLAAFIRANSQQIIEERETFARTLFPVSNDKTPLSLRDHIKQILVFVADDMEARQTDEEQIKKSHGEKSRLPESTAAETHASLRQAAGFGMDQMVSEYRALRASVTKLWKRQLAEVSESDVSDLTRFNESIDQALTESISHYSEKLDHSRSLFLGILSHDLRTPLGAIQMSARLALTIGPLNERQTMLIAQIDESIVRATEIVDHLLDLTRTRLGSGIPVIKEPMDMTFVARQLVDEMRSLHPRQTFALEITGNTKGRWDRSRIGQVFSNLLSNAVQYGFTDAPITVTIEGKRDELLVSVHNEGAPIPPEKMDRLFDSLTRFETDEDAYRHKSINLGLGLYITKEIVVAHDGTITVTSSESGGTTFIACFPQSDAASTAAASLDHRDTEEV